ncbi:type I DNA topoisomerase [Entomospira entomophila]|uniref:DNA topoisomerase 1 n=1 Tax=Entomospira entomophila TaxID=2719988 RepID=A0A968G7B2_9SPIO|nr:type I DNA topoisomerase [Entomospira entomophilus]NIZ39918.1 type I DNA topoisomerase [Entomospira entomophilus]WDI35480.1 type I DNA topoisomerase [Entomospira entomophilus]
MSKSGSKKLIIVESPHKAAVIQKFLGKEFKAMASVGHIRDLPKGGRGKKALGIDIENNFAMKYDIIKGKEKRIEELKSAVSQASDVFLAPDPDREGEAIAWHLSEALGLDSATAKRITYTAVTKKAVLEAMNHARSINMDLVNAQQARRALDRLVGFSLSPFLWQKVARNLSAGRVQSPAVKIIVERDREIDAFVTQEYWSMKAIFVQQGKEIPIVAQLSQYQSKKFGIDHPLGQSEAGVEQIVQSIQGQSGIVERIEKKDSQSKPSAPFTTSTLQQSANIYLRYSATRTMRIAQRLYEGIEIEGSPTGLITYMRTDSVNIDPQAVTEAREFIQTQYGADYLPEKAPKYSSNNKNAQDAHEAIRPTDVTLTPSRVKAYLGNDEFRLYEMIWLRFMQSQMSPARYANTSFKIHVQEAIFEAKGRQLLFDGFLALTKEKRYDEESTEDKSQEEELILPEVALQEHLNMENVQPQQHFTKPPARFNEASLVKSLEKEGIGRPSTYAPIIQTILERGYVIQKERSFYATELGVAVSDLLATNFSNIVDLHFTAGMEEKLDLVEQGEQDWQVLLKEFYFPFIAQVDSAIKDVEPLKGRSWHGEEVCPNCGENLVVRYSKSGAFLGCHNYPTCKGVLPMPGQQGDAVEDENGISQEHVECPICQKVMELKKSRFGQYFYACSDYPECKGTVSVDKEGKPIILPRVNKSCDKCGKPMIAKMSRQGVFLACTGYPDCQNTMALNKDGTIELAPELKDPVMCDKCGSAMIVKRGPRGWFLACSKYPKCRSAKPMPQEAPESTK